MCVPWAGFVCAQRSAINLSTVRHVNIFPPPMGALAKKDRNLFIVKWRVFVCVCVRPLRASGVVGAHTMLRIDFTHACGYDDLH